MDNQTTVLPRPVVRLSLLRMSRVLVTGANGFAGVAICRHLLARDWVVRGAVRRADVSNAAIAEAFGWSPAYTLDEDLTLNAREAA